MQKLPAFSKQCFFLPSIYTHDSDSESQTIYVIYLHAKKLKQYNVTRVTDPKKKSNNICITDHASMKICTALKKTRQLKIDAVDEY